MTRDQRWRRIVSVVLVAPVLTLSSLTLSAPPTPFDGWRASSSGYIDAPCPSGFSCELNVRETGIFERKLYQLSTGRTFVQVVVVDGATNDTGRMSNESFIDMSNQNLEGVALKQVISQRGEYNMDYSVILNTGWADTGNAPTIEFSQTLTDTTAEGVSLDYGVEYRANIGPNDEVTGHYFGIRQRVDNSTRLRPGANSGGTDIQTFVLRRASGDMVPSAGSATLPAAAGMGMGGGAGAVGAGGGGGGGMMALATPQTTGSRGSSTVANNRGVSTGVTITGTSSGAGDPPCGFDPPTNITPGQPPPCSANIAPTNPGSVGTGNGAGAAAPSGTLTPPPRGGGTIPVPAQPPGVPTGIPGMGAGGAPGGGTVTWAAGNEVQVIWIGQTCPGCMIAGAMGMGGGNGSLSYQAYENLSTGATAITRSITGTAPFNWNNPPFGPQPGL